MEHMVRGRCRELAERGRPIDLGGFVGPAEAADLISWADYLIIPSRIESIPVILSDAIQLHTPLIATPVGDIPAIMEQYRIGLLAGSTDAESLEECIRKALETPPETFAPGLRRAGTLFSTAAAVNTFRRRAGLADHDNNHGSSDEL